MSNEMISVNKAALTELMRAILGPEYLIRELHVTRGINTDNPINVLLKDIAAGIPSGNEEAEKKDSGVARDPKYDACLLSYDERASKKFTSRAETVRDGIAIGSIVRPQKANKKLESNGNMYSIATVVSLTPFVLVSSDAVSRWSDGVDMADFTEVGFSVPRNGFINCLSRLHE